MTEVRCNNCDELNDINAVKCETCKAILHPTTEPICSEEDDECESDFRFIEEAEFIGEVYKLENLDELEGHFNEQGIKSESDGLDGNICCEIPNGYVESIVKLEDGDNENVTFEIVTVEPKPTPNIGNVTQFDEKNKLDENDNDSTVQKNQINKINVNKHEDNRKKLNAIGKEENEMTAQGAPYQCTQCPKSFKRKATLKAHINRIHNSDDFSACCAGHVHRNDFKSSNHHHEPTAVFAESCESEYICSSDNGTEMPPSIPIKPSSSPRKRKRKLKHESDSENNNSHKKSPKKCKIELNPCSNSNEIVYKCAACEKITESYQEHLKHIVIHEKVDDSLTVTTSLEQLKKTPSGFLECKECGGVFMSEREYNIHQRSHQGVHQCDICKTILLTPSSLRKHKLRMHRQRTSRKATLFECNICNEKYESQLLMLQHRKKHTEVMKKIEEMTIIDRSGGKATYVCKVCAKTSNNKFRHEEHLRIHTKEKPYKCEKCGIGIATSNAMAHHMRTHENVTFECNVCDATYRHKKSLKKHLKLHTGERPFQCRHCDKRFAFNYTRADHERKCHIDGGTSRIQKRRKKVSSAKAATESESEKKDSTENGPTQAAANETQTSPEEVDLV